MRPQQRAPNAPTRQTALQAFLDSRKRKANDTTVNASSSSSSASASSAVPPPVRAPRSASHGAQRPLKVPRTISTTSTNRTSINGHSISHPTSAHRATSALSAALNAERARLASQRHVYINSNSGMHSNSSLNRKVVVTDGSRDRASEERQQRIRAEKSQSAVAAARRAAQRMRGEGVPLVGLGSRAGVRGESLVREVAENACLTPTQRAVFDAVMAGKSVFLTGGAGVGKSYLVRAIVAALTLLDGVETAVTASTGIAALQVGGTTLHRWAGIGTGTGGRQAMLERASKRQAIWVSTTVLIVDEISMISAELFDDLEYVARQLRGVTTPFGGLQVVAVGDFYQLPPVALEGAASYCFEASSWSRCMQTAFELTEIFRQRNERFISVLNEIRRGVVSEEGHAMLDGARTVKHYADGIEPTKMFPTNAAVDRINLDSLQRLPGTSVSWYCVDSAHPDPSAPYGTILSDAQTEQVLKQLDGCLAPEELQLKVGAQVMLLRNIGDEDLGLANGSRGVVVSIDNAKGDASDSSKSAESEKRVQAEEEFTARNHKGRQLLLPTVRFANGVSVVVRPVEFEASCRGLGVAVRHQIPLKLAYALTIHKTQGMTIDRATLSLKNVFEFGQAYVALSRMSALDSCCVTDWSASAIRANPKVDAFYRTIAESQRQLKSEKESVCDVSGTPAT